MRLASKQLAATAFALMLLPSAGFGQDTAADEQQIRDLEQQWAEAVEDRNLDAIVDLFAEDGRIMAPNAEAAMGRDSVRETWQGILQLPELDFSFDGGACRRERRHGICHRELPAGVQGRRAGGAYTGLRQVR